MRAKKIDANQPELVKQMRAIGMSVFVTSMVGNGFIDAVCGFRKINYLFEIKDPSKPPSQRQLTPDEKAFFAGWKGEVYKVETIDDVLKIVNGK